METINNSETGAVTPDHEIYDYSVVRNVRDNWDVEVFTTEDDANGFRERFEFEFIYPPSIRDMMKAIEEARVTA
jgi:hypothetical protein